jgi:hypothetical protein
MRAKMYIVCVGADLPTFRKAMRMLFPERGADYAQERDRLDSERRIRLEIKQRRLSLEALDKRISTDINFPTVVEISTKQKAIVDAARREMRVSGEIIDAEKRQERAKSLNSRRMRLLLLAIFLSQTVSLIYSGREQTLMTVAAPLVCLAIFWLVIEARFGASACKFTCWARTVFDR